MAMVSVTGIVSRANDRILPAATALSFPSGQKLDKGLKTHKIADMLHIPDIAFEIRGQIRRMPLCRFQLGINKKFGVEPLDSLCCHSGGIIYFIMIAAGDGKHFLPCARIEG